MAIGSVIQELPQWVEWVRRKEDKPVSQADNVLELYRRERPSRRVKMSMPVSLGTGPWGGLE